MIKKKIMLVGGGGHCKACIDVIEQANIYHIEGILDNINMMGATILGYKIVGDDSDIIRYINEECFFFVTIGQIKSAENRIRIFQNLKINKAITPNIISPRAYVSKHAELGDGNIVMHGAIVNAGVKIGNNCILNTGCTIEHDAVIGNHNHISTSATINGGSIIGDEVFIGSNATISNQINISKGSIIGSGSVVIKNIEEPGTYVGNPVIKIK
ncbi:acetyltransferase [Pedobacter hartonius]|uniref:Sugar O-acyltransferase, sialic acid O-acetyltransferase NeuD family n=1 Tax=Pedobacter hartonius TaxID=425514 RepID=A0A1H4FS49_9SPHI|nr:acetyltransferase [Pedobacter hartonius]SEA99971.1 sugar O-acyltransferase, sialic acid O-acetyltransferase NeuD family [Pedobacter hartonius]